MPDIGDCDTGLWLETIIGTTRGPVTVSNQGRVLNKGHFNIPTKVIVMHFWQLIVQCCLFFGCSGSCQNDGECEALDDTDDENKEDFAEHSQMVRQSNINFPGFD